MYKNMGRVRLLLGKGEKVFGKKGTLANNHNGEGKRVPNT